MFTKRYGCIPEQSQKIYSKAESSNSTPKKTSFGIFYAVARFPRYFCDGVCAVKFTIYEWLQFTGSLINHEQLIKLHNFAVFCSYLVTGTRENRISVLWDCINSLYYFFDCSCESQRHIIYSITESATQNPAPAHLDSVYSSRSVCSDHGLRVWIFLIKFVFLVVHFPYVT